MFDILFGWRKASKCKKLIKRAQARLKLLKNKRSSIVRQLRDDVAQLIKTGHEDVAVERAEQLFKDESIIAVYDLLDHFCEFIIVNFPYIRRHKDCPNDVNEAISSVIFASARCGDIPELRRIRKLFGERYGEGFAATAVELLAGNLVNRQIRDNLSIKSVPQEVKLRLVDEIYRDCCLKSEILVLEFSSEQQRQMQMKESMEKKVKDDDVRVCLDSTKESQLQAPVGKEIATKAVLADSIVTAYELQNTAFESLPQTHPELEKTSLTCMDSRPSKNLSDSSFSPGKPKVIALNAEEIKDSSTSIRRGLEPNEDVSALSSSSGSSPQFPEGKVVYLDDVEELQSLPEKDGNGQDQRLFKFKPLHEPREKTPEDDIERGYMEEYDSWDEKSTSKSSRRSEVTSGKTSRRRSRSRENQRIDSSEFPLLYEKPGKNPNDKHSSGNQRKNLKNLAEEQDQLPCSGKKSSQSLYPVSRRHCSSSCILNYVSPVPHQVRCFNCKMECSLGHSCCHNTGSGRRSLSGLQTRNGKAENLNERFCLRPGRRNKSFHVDKMSTSIQLPQKTSSFENDSMLYSIFTYRNSKLNKNMGRRGRVPEEHDSSGSDTSSIIDGFEEEVPSAYLRAMTMPPERQKDNLNDKVPRSNSFPLQHPNHVHPKLPNYEDIAAKFSALKKEYSETRRVSVENKIPSRV